MPKLVNNAPTIIGSLTDLEVISGSEGFAVGDIVNITSSSGVQATARVSKIKSQSGLVEFTLLDGGFGFTANAQIIISDTSLDLVNIERSYSSFGNIAPQILEPVTQPLANIIYDFANGSFANGDSIFVYNGVGAVLGEGKILNVNPSNSTFGNLFVSIISGNLEANTVYYNQGNAVTANLNPSGYIDSTVTGSLLQIPDELFVHFSAANGVFLLGDSVFQKNTSSAEIANGIVANVDLINSILKITNVSSIFYTGTNVVSRSSNVTANCNSLDLKIGLQSNIAFTALEGAWVYDNNFFTFANTFTASRGIGANFTIGTFNNLETILFNTDYITDYAAVLLDAPDYGVGINHANAATLISTALNYSAINIGSISSLSAINPGNNYAFSPVVLIYEPFVAPFYRKDYIFNISDATDIFQTGERISQANSGAFGIIKTANSSSVRVKRIQFENKWIAGFFPDDTWLLYGSASNAYANLISIEIDAFTFPIGENAIIETNTVTSNSSVENLEVLSSGFCFNQNDVVTFTSSDETRSGTGFGYLNKQGISPGYYRNRKGWLSADKKIIDSYYWQQFSYDIRAAVSPPIYKQMLESLLHIAGKKYFQSVVRDPVLKGSPNILPSISSGAAQIAPNMMHYYPNANNSVYHTLI